MGWSTVGKCALIIVLYIFKFQLVVQSVSVLVQGFVYSHTVILYVVKVLYILH